MATQGLNPATVRMLHDKMYEKRKVAALEIEKLVRNYSASDSNNSVQQVISMLTSEFTISQNPNSRKGGLIGLAACAIALGHQHIQPFLESLLKPVLVCTSDPDSRMRYFACESLYNIVKVSRSDTLPYFNELFDALSKLSADPDPNVRNGSDLLDRLLKDIITETPVFDVSSFVILLRERMYTKKQYTRRFLVQWLTCVMSIPEVDILAFLPEFLEGLFPILGDTSKEIRSMCQSTLGELLTRIEATPDKVDCSAIVNIVVNHCHSTDVLIKETSLIWVNRLIGLAGPTILPFSSGIIAAVLPTLAYDTFQRKTIPETAKTANQSLMKLITSEYDEDKDSSCPTLPLAQMVDVFSDHFKHRSNLTRCASLKWISHLLVQIPHRIFVHIDKIFQELMEMLRDACDDVVLLTLECFAEITSSTAGQAMNSGIGIKHSLSSSMNFSSTDDSPLFLNDYFSKFISGLLLMFRSDAELLEHRSSFIIRQLSVLLNAENVFQALGEALNDDEEFQDDPRFCFHAVKKLNAILMTSSELAQLRNKLKHGTSKETSELFCCLYKSWCHSPVATVTLCLLSQNYQHCCELLQKFSDFDMTVEFLVDLDKLVHLLESPIFSYLRLQLLETPHRRHLTKCMYSILMLLPQSKSFLTLHQRLNCIPSDQMLSSDVSKSNKMRDGNNLKDVKFDSLFKHFVEVQKKHVAFRRCTRLQATKTS